jgi:hypothetical protein
LKEVFCPVLEFGKEKRTFTKVEKGNVDFFYAEIGLTKPGLYTLFGSDPGKGAWARQLPRPSILGAWWSDGPAYASTPRPRCKPNTAGSLGIQGMEIYDVKNGLL